MHKKTNKDIVKKYQSNKDSLGLKERYLKIFEFKNGLMDGVPHTLKESARKFGVSGHRIYQIEARVKFELEKLEDR